MQCGSHYVFRGYGRLWSSRVVLFAVLLTVLPVSAGLKAQAQQESQPSVEPHMAAEAHPQIDVATIKPTKVDVTDKSFGAQGREFTTMNTTLEEVIEFAYGVQARQVVGAPTWVSKDPFDIHAVVDSDSQPSVKQWKSMLQNLMADRFQLAYHQDQRTMNAYVLEQSKEGPKLKPSKGDPEGTPVISLFGLQRMEAVNASMVDLITVLQSSILDRPVIDRTGIQGRWDFSLRWAPDEAQLKAPTQASRQADGADAPPPLFTALQDQAGLRLDAEKTAVPVIVIDHVEKPEAN